MKDQVLKWCVDVLLLVMFLLSAVTGLIKYANLMHLPILTSTPLPLALISDIHDRAGLLLALLVAVHLYLNRRWILRVTRTMVSGGDGSRTTRDQDE